jgi:hypothetical protein
MRPRSDGTFDLGAGGTTDRRYRYLYLRDTAVIGGDAAATAKIIVSKESNDTGVAGADSSHTIQVDASGNPEHIFAGANGNAWKIGLDSDKLTFWFKDNGSWIKKASIDTTGGYTDEY